MSVTIKQNHSNSSSSEVLVALSCYCLSSIMMTLTNKLVLSSKEFNLNVLLLLAQSVITLVLLVSFKTANLIDYQRFNFGNAAKWLPVSALLVAMIYTGSKSLQYLPVANFTIFKNITIIIIAYGDVQFFNGSVNRVMMISFGLMIASSLIGGYGDISFNFTGYMWMILNCFASAAYVLYMRKTIKQIGFKDLDTVYYNNILAIPLMFFLSYVLEDWGSTFAKYGAGGPLESELSALIKGIILSSFTAFAISYSTAWCVRVASSTTYSMVGALNKLPVAISGILFIPNERNVSFLNVLSIVIAFSSGIIYSIAQMQLKRRTLALPMHQQAVKS